MRPLFQLTRAGLTAGRRSIDMVTPPVRHARPSSIVSTNKAYHPAGSASALKPASGAAVYRVQGAEALPAARAAASTHQVLSRGSILFDFSRSSALSFAAAICADHRVTFYWCIGSRRRRGTWVANREHVTGLYMLRIIDLLITPTFGYEIVGRSPLRPASLESDKLV